MAAKKSTPIDELVQPRSMEEIEAERRDAGAKLSVNQLVKPAGEGFDVFSDEGKFHVSRDLSGTICTCPDFDGAATLGISDYKCEHIYAVKHHTMGLDEPQKPELKDVIFRGDGEIDHVVDPLEPEKEEVLPEGASFIQQLSRPLPKGMIKTRDVKWGKGFVEYITWTTAADILDKIADSNWSFEIKQVLMGQSSVTIVAALTVFGVTRDGVGVCDVAGDKWEMAIKGAASDSLKRAAVMFGIARQLYEDDVPSEDTPKRNASFQGNVQGNGGPVATSLGNMVTAKQLGMIRAIAREANVDAEAECRGLLKCELEELSKTAASDLITHLQATQRNGGQQAKTTW